MKRLLAIFSCLFASGCGDERSPSAPGSWRAGGVYSIDNGNGTFGVAKVLVLEPGIVHVRVYKNKFESRPHTVDRSALSLGSIHDKDGFGMGHLPISADSFSSWRPVLLMEEPVSEGELDGYNMWKEAKGGVFG